MSAEEHGRGHEGPRFSERINPLGRNFTHTWKLHFRFEWGRRKKKKTNKTKKTSHQMYLNEAPGPGGSFLRPCQLLWSSTHIQRLQLRTQYWMSHIHVMNKLILFFHLVKRSKAGTVPRGRGGHGQDVSSPPRVGFPGQTEILLLPLKLRTSGRFRLLFR